MAYLSRVLEAAFTALEGLNKQAFLTELVSGPSLRFFWLFYVQLVVQICPPVMIAHASANKEFLCSLPKEEWYVYFYVIFLLFLTRVSWHIGGGIASTSLLSIPFSIIVQWFCSLYSFLFSLSGTSNSHCHWALSENWCAFIFKLLGDLFQLSEDTALASAITGNDLFF